MGLVWAVANPTLMLGIFTFVFAFVFTAKLPGSERSLSYVIWLISGYGPWLAIIEGLSTSTSAVTSNAGLVKNLAFKTELLPIAGSLMGLVPLAVSMSYLAVLLVFDGTVPSLSWLVMVPVVVTQFLLVTGIGLFLSAVNVFVRDTALALPNVLLMLLFASPIFYPIENFPIPVQTVLQFNPFYLIAESYRQPLLHHTLPQVWRLAYLAALSTAVFMGGLAFFRRLKGHFDARL